MIELVLVSFDDLLISYRLDYKIYPD